MDSLAYAVGPEYPTGATAVASVTGATAPACVPSCLLRPLKQIMTPTIAHMPRKPRPPTTPPTIAPVLGFDPVCVGGGEVTIAVEPPACDTTEITVLPFSTIVVVDNCVGDVTEGDVLVEVVLEVVVVVDEEVGLVIPPKRFRQPIISNFYDVGKSLTTSSWADNIKVFWTFNASYPVQIASCT